MTRTRCYKTAWKQAWSYVSHTRRMAKTKRWYKQQAHRKARRTGREMKYCLDAWDIT